MKIVQVEDVPLLRGLEHRGGTFRARTMVERQPGTAGNFKFSLSRLGTDYSGPRHRHNFDRHGLPDLSDMSTARSIANAAIQAAE